MAELRHKYFAGSQEAFRAESRRIAQRTPHRIFCFFIAVLL